MEKITAAWHRGDVQQGALYKLIKKLTTDPFNDTEFRFSYDTADDFFKVETGPLKRRMEKDIEALEKNFKLVSGLESEMLELPPEQTGGTLKRLYKQKEESELLEQYAFQSQQVVGTLYDLWGEKTRKVLERFEKTVEDQALGPKERALGTAFINKLTQIENRLYEQKATSLLKFQEYRQEYVPQPRLDPSLRFRRSLARFIDRWGESLTEERDSLTQAVQTAEREMEKHSAIDFNED